MVTKQTVNSLKYYIKSFSKKMFLIIIYINYVQKIKVEFLKRIF